MIKIDIDMDKKCTRCGQDGQTRSGLCLRCVSESYSGGLVTRLTKTQVVVGLYEFTPEELAAMKSELPFSTWRLDRLEAAKGRVSKWFSDKTKSVRTRMSALTRQIRAGAEMMPRECFVEKDWVERRLRYIDCETGRVLKIESFGPKDAQMSSAEQILKAPASSGLESATGLN